MHKKRKIFYNKAKKIFFVCCFLFGFILTGMNIYMMYKQVNRKSGIDSYSNIWKIQPSCEKMTFWEKHIPKGSRCYLWDRPDNNNWITTECLVSKINYNLYPTILRYKPENLKGVYDYILCNTDDYEELNLYMTFFDIDESFVVLAKNNTKLILKNIGLPKNLQHIKTGR